MAEFRYAAYGLEILSDFECPELPPGSGRPDVVFRQGLVPECLTAESGGDSPLDSAVFQARPGKCLLRIPGIARYLISEGREIQIEAAEPAEWDSIRLLLLSSALGALLYQRKKLVLHASAVANASGAVLFAGPSAAGKSTLAAALCRRGLRLITDELAVLHSESSPRVAAGASSLLLWSDAIQALGERPEDFRPVRPTLEKRALPFPGEFSTEAALVRAVCLLEAVNCETCSATEIRGFRKIEAIGRNAFRKSLMPGSVTDLEHFEQLSRFASQVRVFAVRRPSGKFDLEALADLVMRDILR